MKHIGTIVASAVLVAGLTVASQASAAHATCEQMGNHFLRDIELANERGINVVGHGDAYGEPRMVAPKDYIQCVLDTFDEGKTDYRIEVKVHDPDHGDGTTYTIQLK